MNKEHNLDEVFVSAYEGHKRLEEAIKTGRSNKIDLDLEQALDRKHIIMIKVKMLEVHKEHLGQKREKLLEVNS
jgi:hypothetical protein